MVGGGPAGLSAALWMARHRREVVVLDSREYRNRWVEQSHGYLGRDGMDPMKLLGRARDDLAKYPTARYVVGTATGARRNGDAFLVKTEESTFETRAVVLATGVTDAFPEVEGLTEHYGAGLFHCPTCDGYEARDLDVVAIGWSEFMVGFAEKLSGWARSVTIVTDGRPFGGDQRDRDRLAELEVAVIEEDAVALTGTRGDLKGVRLAGGDEIPCGVAFFAVDHRPRVSLATELGCKLTEEGCVVVDDRCRTSVPGVYAAGDLTPGIQLVQLAAGKGVLAGVTCSEDLGGAAAT